MADRKVNHEYIIQLYGATPEEREVLDYSILKDGIGNKGQLTLWEVDALTAKYSDQKKFLADVHQFLTFEPKGIKIVTNDPACRPIIFGDNNIAYLAEAMSKKNPSVFGDATVDDVSKDNDLKYGYNLVETLVNNYREALSDPGKLKVMAALYNSKIADYHLNFLLNYFEVLASACNYQQDYIGAGSKDVFESAIREYNNFREAYIFYKRFEFDYKTIMVSTNYETISSARVVVDDAHSGYKYILNFANSKSEVISSHTRLLNEKIKDELVFINKVDKEEKVELPPVTSVEKAPEIVAKNTPPTNNIIDFTSMVSAKPAPIEEEFEGEGMSKKLVSDHNMFAHEDYINDYDIGDEKEDQSQPMSRDQFNSYIKYLEERGTVAARRNKPKK